MNNESPKTEIEGRLRIVLKPGCENLKRVTPRNLDVTLNGEPLPPWYCLNLILDTEGAVRVELGMWATGVDVDATVMEALVKKPEPIIIPVQCVNNTPQFFEQMQSDLLELESIADRVKAKCEAASESVKSAKNSA